MQITFVTTVKTLYFNSVQAILVIFAPSQTLKQINIGKRPYKLSKCTTQEEGSTRSVKLSAINFEFRPSELPPGFRFIEYHVID